MNRFKHELSRADAAVDLGGPYVSRHCFLLRVRPDRLEEYKERHRHVWPDMLEALQETGWRNYSLFLDDDGLLVGYVECDDLAKVQAAMSATEVNTRWQAEMAPFFVNEGAPDLSSADAGIHELPEVFHLEDQLESIKTQTTTTTTKDRNG